MASAPIARNASWIGLENVDRSVGRGPTSLAETSGGEWVWRHEILRCDCSTRRAHRRDVAASPVASLIRPTSHAHGGPLARHCDALPWRLPAGGLGPCHDPPLRCWINPRVLHPPGCSRNADTPFSLVLRCRLRFRFFQSGPTCATTRNLSGTCRDQDVQESRRFETHREPTLRSRLRGRLRQGSARK